MNLSKRQKKNETPVVDAADTSNATVEALLDAADPVTASDDEVDPEILAMLGDDSVELPAAVVVDPEAVADTAVDLTTDGTETVATDDVDVTIEAEDEDAILAELEDDDSAAAPAAAGSKPARKKREPKAPAVATRQFTDVAAIDPAALKANLDASTAKKVNEKIQNLVQAVETGKTLSRYTQVAVKTLVRDGKISGKSLVEAFQAENLSIGTARAQSQQMTALFKTVGLVTPAADAPRELMLADQGLADELVKLAA
jgi:hypothetical protein